jgi:aminodeoxyfutalosine deaminase
VRKLSADYVFPVSQPPVKKGIIIVDGSGKIAENVIDPSTVSYSLQDVEYHPGFICPGFVNSHCHLELSYLKDKMKEHSGLDNFIVELEEIRKGINEDEKTEAIYRAEQEMIKNGIVAIADICNSSSTFSIKNQSRIFYHTFIESFASDPQRAGLAFDKALKLYNDILQNRNNNAASITPHAPYSLSKDLFSKIKDFAEKTGNIISMHHQESEEENKFFLSDSGNIKTRHMRFGVERSDFSESGLRPLAAIADFLPKDNSIQLVHNTVTTDIDIDFAVQRFKDLYWCFCPKANLFIEQRLPEFALFYNKKCKITIGTDSLASNRSLSVFDELRTIWASIPFIPLNEMLKWATLHGAEFIKQSSRIGSIEKGKTPGLVLMENMNNEKIHFTREAFVRVLI